MKNLCIYLLVLICLPAINSCNSDQDKSINDLYKTFKQPADPNQFTTGIDVLDKMDTNVLFDFSHAEDNRLKKFSGTLTYTGSFEIDGEAFKILQIPVKSSVTELYINQEHVGINYFGNNSENGLTVSQSSI